MKNITLLLLVIFVQGITCNDAILSKFKQMTFKMKDQRTELVRYNKSIINFFEIKTFKYNRTTTAHNCTLIPKINLEDKLELLVQGYKFLSNEFRIFPVRFQVNLKKSVDANIIGSSNAKMCGNMTDFIFRKDIIYHFCNFVADENYLPPLIPNGIYKNEVIMLYLNQEALVLNVFGEIYTPIAYSKK